MAEGRADGAGRGPNRPGASRLAPLLVLTALLVLMVGCGSDGAARGFTASGAVDATTPDASIAGPQVGAITVSAASSLTESFTAIGDAFVAANPAASVDFSFDASSALATQIIEGAPADVFASADEANMAKVVDADLVSGAPEVFARNRLVIVTKPGNPAGITGLADLATTGVVSLCGKDVPCGRFATQALIKAGVTIPESSVTRGQNVKATLTAVTEGDAVAAIVYVTDARTAGDAVATVEIPDDVNVIASYPIGVLAVSADPEVAEAFMAFVLAPEGQAILASYGFLPPR